MGFERGGFCGSFLFFEVNIKMLNLHAIAQLRCVWLVRILEKKYSFRGQGREIILVND